jgi:carbamoyl-phosphate synthase large subunit
VRKLRFLVTGVAGDIGFGIGKILRKSFSDSFLLGIDTNQDNPALMVFDQFIKSYHADLDNYYKDIIALVIEKQINFIIPTSESEISIFWEKGLVSFFENINVSVLILDQDIVNTSLDKFKTFKFLKVNGFSYPNTYLAKDFKTQNNFPMIFKLRSGQGSKELRILHSLGDIKVSEKTDKYIVQELLSDENQEYTCCVFSDGNIYRSIVIRRKLKNGFTYSGEVVEDQEIDTYIVDISKALKLKGSINFQLRMTDRGPVLFEINPRFSSTVVFRDKLGFSDLIWSVQLMSKNKISKYIKPKNGTKVYRGINEYII